MPEELLSIITMNGGDIGLVAGALAPWGIEILSCGEWEDFNYLGKRSQFIVRV